MCILETKKLISKNIEEALSKIKIDASLGIRKNKVYISKNKDLLGAVYFKFNKEIIASLISSNKKEKYKPLLHFDYPVLRYSERAKEDKNYCSKKEREKELRSAKQKECLWCNIPFEKFGDNAPVLHHKNMSGMIESMDKLKKIMAKAVLESKMSIESGFGKLNEADISILQTYKLLIDCVLICNKCHREYHQKRNNYFFNN